LENELKVYFFSKTTGAVVAVIVW